MQFTLTLDNTQRISLRRILRERAEKQRSLVCDMVRAGQLDGAKDAVEELDTMESVLRAIRDLEPQA